MATRSPQRRPPRRVTASTRPGMGAVPYDGGVTFRVWAPFATGVSVAGTFNRGSATANRLAQESGGTWSADVPGAKPGDEYHFVIRNQRTHRRIDPYARNVTHSAGRGIVAVLDFPWTDHAYRMPAWDELVIYELHIGTFNVEAEIAAGGRPGGFLSVVPRLDYLRDLGVNAIEVMPSMEFARDFSWGYNPSHIFALERAYGGPEGFKELVRQAHARGIAVIFDVVYNHLGPDDLDLWQFDGWSENGMGGIYFYNDHRSTTPWGDTRPDYGREEVRRFLLDNVRMWLEEFHLDGLRWDATAYIRNIHGHDNNPGSDIPDGWWLMQLANDQTDESQPWKLQIAEDLRGNDWITRETRTGGAGFDTQWDGEFVHPVRRAMIPPDDGARSLHALRRAIEHRYGGDPVRRVIYTESHDEVANGQARLPEEIWPGSAGSWAAQKRSTLGAALVFTSPGIPMIFQGQEFLEDEWFRDTHPLDWQKAERYAGILALYRDLIRLRRNRHGTTRGLRGPHVNVFHLNHADKVMAFHRWHGGGPRDDVVVVVNAANRAYGAYTIGFPRGGAWRVRFNSDWAGYSPEFGGHPSHHTIAHPVARDGLPFSGDIGIGPYTAVILSQDD